MIYLLVSFGVAVVFIGLSGLFFDMIIRRMYREHYQSWVEAGSPVGHYFHPEGLELSTAISSQVHGIRMMFKTPEWTRTDPRGAHLLLFYRITSFVGTAALAVFAYFFFWMGR